MFSFDYVKDFDPEVAKAMEGNAHPPNPLRAIPDSAFCILLP